MSNTNNLHAFLCTYHGWTEKKPSRIKIKSLRFNQYIWISPENGMRWELDAIMHLENLGYDIVGLSEYPGHGFIIVSNLFKPLKDE